MRRKEVKDYKTATVMELNKKESLIHQNSEPYSKEGGGGLLGLNLSTSSTVRNKTRRREGQLFVLKSNPINLLPQRVNVPSSLYYYL